MEPINLHNDAVTVRQAFDSLSNGELTKLAICGAFESRTDFQSYSDEFCDGLDISMHNERYHYTLFAYACMRTLINRFGVLYSVVPGRKTQLTFGGRVLLNILDFEIESNKFECELWSINYNSNMKQDK